MFLIVGAALATVWGVPFIGLRLGYEFGDLQNIILPLMAGLLLFHARSFFIRCPQCGRSVFKRDYGIGLPLWSPIPAKECGRCGRDLTEV